jgi:alkylation response protein AidB-like acyl-CoA dehydrogenase
VAAYEYVEYTVTDGRAEVVMNRPDVLNAFHDPMVEELVLALLDAHTDDRVYCIVLTGAGRAFCSGGDVSAAVEAHESGQPPGRLVASMANLYSARTLEYVASEALQVHGANGFQRGHPIEYLYRFGRSRRIAAGTDEIQLNTIAGALKREGLPWLA